ncbi:SDR family oxidoreductase [Streptomyces sp. NA04227]|uniref:SDR family NAD(P)-dependent oxidoreductase n=1 Tax=Streptomyces sp. NA04227 TaxID=2742136 RepID=UPI0015908E2A|nr:SDR family NAD(P)-dependent oxidoreductase [Streptomyces sp. NA04227]QKW09690.1 SDR family oxidoreductase [Streptomyces sp. NA04227]
MSPAAPERKAAFVTGAGSGIGAAAARALGRAGYAVAVCDLSATAAQETAEALRASGVRTAVYTVDVTNGVAVADAVRAAGDELGPLEAVVHAAGIFDQNRPFAELTAATWDLVLRVNVLGTANVLRAVLPAMTERRHGSVITVASSAGLVPRGGGAAYIASKHAVVGLTLKVAAEVADRGVRVNAVAPGWIPTRLFETSAAALRADAPSTDVPDEPVPVGGVIPMRRPGTADEVADGIVFLAGDSSRYITGTVLPVDGGYLVG